MENEVKKEVNNNQQPIVGAIIIAGVLIAGAILLKGSSPDGSPTTAGNEIKNVMAMEARPVSKDDHIIGNIDAPVVIIEYSDIECPFCKMFQNTLKNVVQKNNKVAWVYRHFPIASLHPDAFQKAEATECAWDQGGNDIFWKYLDELLSKTGSNNKIGVVELTKIAKDMGLDASLFDTCLSSGKFKEKVENDMSDGNKAGARGTPFSLVITKKDISSKIQKDLNASLGAEAISFGSNNKKVMSLNGALPEEMINEILSALLK